MQRQFSPRCDLPQIYSAGGETIPLAAETGPFAAKGSSPDRQVFPTKEREHDLRSLGSICR